MFETPEFLAKYAEKVEAEFPKLKILEYYPYGRKTNFSYWTVGDIDLRTVHRKYRNKDKTAQDLVRDIFKEVSMAMYYSTIRQPCCHDGQGVIAFNMCRLFTRGVVDWNRELVDGKSDSWKRRLYAYHEDRSDKLYCKGKYADDWHKEQDSLHESYGAEWLERYNQVYREGTIANRERYGIYEVKHFPLMPYGGNKTPLYTKQELAAISLMVDCEFENQC